jgi:hypothetical protein
MFGVHTWKNNEKSSLEWEHSWNNGAFLSCFRCMSSKAKSVWERQANRQDTFLVIPLIQGWPEPYICTVYERISGDFPAKKTAYITCRNGFVQLYSYTLCKELKQLDYTCFLCVFTLYEPYIYGSGQPQLYLLPVCVCESALSTVPTFLTMYTLTMLSRHFVFPPCSFPYTLT